MIEEKDLSDQDEWNKLFNYIYSKWNLQYFLI